ncbi:TPA: hypothetical protein ACH3X1_007591 [Trebouxia sp. C0004]
MLAMGSIEEALNPAAAEDDLQTILSVLEDKSVGFKRHESAAGPFANMDATMLTGLNIRMLSVIKRAQQQQQHQGAGRRDPFVHRDHCKLQDAFECVSPVVYKNRCIGSVTRIL